MPRRSLKALLILVPAALGLLALPALGGVANSASVPSSFSFSGSGWGHGVGLSQVGARGQAAEGRNADQILKHYFSGSTVGAYRDDQQLRVNLGYQVTSMRMRVEALSTGSVAVEAYAGGKSVKAGPKDVLELRTSGSSVVVRKNGAVAVSGSKAVIKWSGTRYSGTTGSSPAVLNLVKGSASFDTSGHRYRYGVVEAVARTSNGSSTLSVNNIVRLHDEYLLGVGEMPSLWPAAALQAQVIASRGYALVKYRQGVRSGCDCHVFATTADQVFVGWSKQSGASGSRWTAAVRATNLTSTTSKVVLVNGAPAQTFFFSSSGGRTQNSEDVWSAKLSYLRSVDDKWSKNPAYNSNASWGPRVRSQVDVAKAFGLPDVVRIDVSDRYASGAVRTAKAWSSRGAAAEVAGPTIMSRLSLTSRWYWPSVAAAPATSTTTNDRFKVAVGAGPANQHNPTKISGFVYPLNESAGGSISIKQWNPATGKWDYLMARKVNSGGWYQFIVTPKSRGTAKYLVYKSSGSCGSGCVRGSSSTQISVEVGPRFWVLPEIASQQKAGVKVPVKGSVSPGSYAKGQTVSISRYYSYSKAWGVVGKATVGSDGRFSTTIPGLPKGWTQIKIYKGSTGCTATKCTLGGGWSKQVSVSTS